MSAAPNHPTIALVRSPHTASSGLRPLFDQLPVSVEDFVVRRSLVDELLAGRPDLVVIDGCLDDFDVLRVCRDLSASIESRIVVAMTPSRLSDEAWVVGTFAAGADDVVASDITPALLHARLSALVRHPPEHEPRVVSVGDVVVNLDAHAVSIGGVPVRFPKQAFNLLVALARHVDRFMSAEELLSDVWHVEPTSVSVHRVRIAASHLRRLLGEGPRRPRLETIPRVGYRLVSGPTT